MRAVVVIFLLGCNDHAACDAADKCTTDPKPTQTEIDTCNQLASGTCGSAYLDVIACEQSQQQCTSAGAIDETATEQQIAANCGEQVSNYGSCCAANAPACN